MHSARPFIAPNEWQQEVLEGIRQNRAVIVIGAPGAGKSTLAAWALAQAEAEHSALLVTPSIRALARVGVDAALPETTRITNRLLREPDWSLSPDPMRATVSPGVLGSAQMARNLANRRWHTLIFDGLDEWSQAAVNNAPTFIERSAPTHIVATSRRERLARELLSKAVTYYAPAPEHVGDIVALTYRETPRESEVRSRIEGLTEFAAFDAARLGLSEIASAWGSSPYAAQEVALKQLALLRPERNVAAHTLRPRMHDSVLLLVVQGLEIVVDAIDRVEHDSRLQRFRQALDTEFEAATHLWLVTGERATSDYLRAQLDVQSAQAKGGDRAVLRIDDDDTLDEWRPHPDTTLVHYDLPSTSRVLERIWLARRLAGRPLAQFALVRRGDASARSVVRAAERQ